MLKIQSSILAISTCLLGASCTTLPVEMPMPANFNAASVEPIKGLEYYKGKGKFKIGEELTRYSRRSDSVTWLERLQTEKVGADFKYSNEGQPVKARCESYEKKIVGLNSGYSKVVLTPLTYGCSFSGESVPDNAVVDLAVTQGSQFQAGNFHFLENLERVGEAQWGASKLIIESIHEDAGIKSPIPSEITPPTGYYFYESGSEVAVLDMIDGFKLHMRSNLSSDTQSAINASVRSVLLHLDVENYY